MSVERELERILAELVVVWPDDVTNPVVEAARDYLHVHCGITVTPGENAPAKASNNTHNLKDLTDTWYSV